MKKLTIDDSRLTISSPNPILVASDVGAPLFDFRKVGEELARLVELLASP
ncbi:MAG TPA: hypothetical protein VJQ82_10885 [Terriglobales bacterium]|nr:hypothetical protein [Terriglobales bacterium]